MMKPLLGAALKLDGLRLHYDWIMERQRDLEIQDFGRFEVLNGDWRSLASEIKKCLAGYPGRLGLHGPFMGLPINSEDPDVRAVVNRRMHQALDVCDHIGATQMVVHSPYTSWNYANFQWKPNARETHIRRIHLTLQDVVERARSIGCVLVMENVEDKDPFERINTVRSFDSPAIRASVDTGHANFLHHCAGAPMAHAFITAAGEMLEHVHIQDTDASGDRHWLPGDGNIAWEDVFAALGTNPGNPRLLLEVRDYKRLRAGADYLARLGLAE
jgi:sugar phosphate isomerase/epimerase